MAEPKVYKLELPDGRIVEIETATGVPPTKEEMLKVLDRLGVKPQPKKEPEKKNSLARRAFDKIKQLAKEPEIQAGGLRLGGAVVGAIKGGARGGVPGAAIGGMVGAAVAEVPARRITPREETFAESAANVAAAGVVPKIVGPLVSRVLRSAAVGGGVNVAHQQIVTAAEENRLLTPREAAISTGVGAGLGGLLGGIIPGGRATPDSPPKVIPAEKNVISKLGSNKGGDPVLKANAKANEVAAPAPKEAPPASQPPKKVAVDDADAIEAAALAQSAGAPQPEVVYLGKKHLAIEGVGEKVDQYQVKMPGDERGVTLTAKEMQERGIPIPERSGAEPPKTSGSAEPPPPTEPPAPPVSTPSPPPEPDFRVPNLVRKDPNAERIRALHARAPDAEVSAETKRLLEADPEASFHMIRLRDAQMRSEAATMDELQAALRSGDEMDKAAALIELSKPSRTPDAAQASAYFSELSKMATAGGQLINLARLVKSPAAILARVEKGVASKSRNLTGEQKERVYRLADEAIGAEDAHAAAKRIASENPTAANTKIYQQALEKMGRAKKELDDLASSLTPETWGDLISKAVQGNLLTPLSLMANVVGNLLWNPVRRGARAVSSAVDALISATNGSKRSMMSGNPIPHWRELQAAYQGARTAAKEMITGPSLDSYAKAEVQRGFAPMRAMVQAWSGEGLAVGADGKVRAADRWKAAFSATFGIPAETMFRLLSLGDKPYRRAAHMEALLEQARLRGIRKGEELEKFLMFPPRAAETAAEDATRLSIFMQENKGLTKFNKFLDEGVAEVLGVDKVPALKGALKVFGRMNVPFRQFPVNYLMTTLNFAVPELAMAKAFFQAKRGRRRLAVQNYGEGLIGMTMYAGVQYLWDAGLVSEAFSKDAKRRSSQSMQMGAAKINISGLKRALDGGNSSYKTGDELIDWTRIGIPAAVIHLWTDQASKSRAEQAGVFNPHGNEAIGLLKRRMMAFPGMTEFALNQSFLAGTSAFLEFMKEPDPEGHVFRRYIGSMFQVAATIPLPNTLDAMARARIEFVPDLQGETLAETAELILRHKLSLLPEGDALVLKRDGLGDPIRRAPDTANRLAFQFSDVFRKGAFAPDPIKDQLQLIFNDTGMDKVYPDIPARTVNIAGESFKLDPKDYELYVEAIGKARRRNLEALLPSEGFNRLDPIQKVALLEDAYSSATGAASAMFLNSIPIRRKYVPHTIGEPALRPDGSRVRRMDTRAILRLQSITGNSGEDQEASGRPESR